MKCPSCGNENPDNAKFCLMCGTSLEMFENPVMPVVETPPAPKEDNLKGYGKYDYKRSHSEKDNKESKIKVRSSASVMISVLLFFLMLVPIYAKNFMFTIIFVGLFIVSLAYCFYTPKRKTISNKDNPELTISDSDDMQTRLAKQELKEHPIDGSKADGFMSFAFFCAAFIIYNIPNKSDSIILWSIVLVPLFIILGIVFWYTSTQVKRHREQLEHLAKGEKIVNVCPKCKSENIQMSMVQSGNVTTHGISRVSKNINPFHPFTHTNVKKGTDYSFATYDNQCQCLNCGRVFYRPEVHYIK